jgi:hypothetical protein
MSCERKQTETDNRRNIAEGRRGLGREKMKITADAKWFRDVVSDLLHVVAAMCFAECGCLLQPWLSN